MKQGQTYHEFECTCDFCKMGDTKQRCQATFKEHCQYPKCDCDRPVTAEVINSREFPRGKRLAELEAKLSGEYVGGMTEYWQRQKDFLLSEKYLKNPQLDPIQNDCIYGFVLPDRCQYTAHLGCGCGAYPPLKWDGEKYVRT